MSNSPSPLGDLGKRKRPVRKLIGLLVLGFLLAILIEFGREAYRNYLEPQGSPQPVAGTAIVPPPKSVAATPPPQQEAAAAANTGCCPCPKKAEAVAPQEKKKKVYKPKSAPVVALAMRPMGKEKGCVEISLPPLRPRDIGVKGFVAGVNHDIARDNCTGFKAKGDAMFKPLSNELCSSVLPIVCDSARQEAVIGHPARLKFSFFTKPGIAYVLRFPSFMATDDSETVVVGLIQSLITEPPGSTRAYRETVQYSKTNNAMMGVPSSCYEGGVATLYYAKSDIPATAGCQLYLFVPRTDWRGP